MECIPEEQKKGPIISKLVRGCPAYAIIPALHIPKIFLFILFFINCCHFSYSQRANSKTLYVIDSIPLFKDPQPWNLITGDDISDVSIITNRDSLKRLGWGNVDAITFIFTKSYRLRPDSIKNIPSLKQMKLKNGEWYLNGMLYSGPYKNYFNSGHIWDEGTLWNGRPNGKIIIYYKSGVVRSVSEYNYGKLDGEDLLFYKNGVLHTRKWFKGGIGNDLFEGFFINGRVEHELRHKKTTSYDTIVVYYSTGKIKHIQLFRDGFLIRKKYEEILDLYRSFDRYPITGDLKQANLIFYKMWRLDSTQIETLLAEALLMSREYRFDEALAKLDRILTIEPLMKMALVARGLSRIQQTQLAGVNPYSQNFNYLPPTIKDLQALKVNEQQKVCIDLLLADDLDVYNKYLRSKEIVQIINYCRNTEFN